MALIALLLLIGGLLPIAGVALLRLVVDSAADAVSNDAPFSRVAVWLGLLVATMFAEKLLLFLDQELGQHRYERLRVRAQEKLISKAGILSLMTFERPEFYDRLRRAQDGVDNNLSVTIRYALWIPTRLITSVGLLVYLATASPILPVIMVAGLIPVYLVSAHYSRRLYDLRRRHAPDERRLDYLGNLMTGREAAAEVRLFGLGSYLLNKRQRLFDQLRDQRLKLARQRAANTVTPTLGDQLTYAVVILGLVVLIAGGDLTVGYFVALLGASGRFRDAVGQLSSYISGLHEAPPIPPGPLRILGHQRRADPNGHGRQTGSASAHHGRQKSASHGVGGRNLRLPRIVDEYPRGRLPGNSGRRSGSPSLERTAPARQPWQSSSSGSTHRLADE